MAILITIWNKFDGYKTYLGIAIRVLQDVAGVLSNIVAIHGLPDLAVFLQGIKTNPNITDLANMIIAAGAAHKLDKAAAPIVPAAPPPAP